MKIDKIKLNFVRGSFIGGAAGDALGYAVEFDRYSEIIDRYGQLGITEYELVNSVAEIRAQPTNPVECVQSLTQKHVAKWYMIAEKLLPLHHES